MTLLAIDPGTTDSGWVVLGDDDGIVASGVWSNDEMLLAIQRWQHYDLVIEMIASYGMPVGASTFETVRWIGRFQQAHQHPDRVMFVYRKDVIGHLCNGNPKAKDPNVRQALIDLFGAPGIKAQPGPTFGVKSHAWAALGVAATVRKLAG